MRRITVPSLLAVHSLSWLQGTARGCTTAASLDIEREVGDLLSEFGETRELIGDARESHGTVYFADDLNDAIKGTRGTIEKWEALRKHLANNAKNEVLQKLNREHEMKFKQLEAELEELMHLD